MGIDVSPEMIELARRHTAGVAGDGQQNDLHVAAFETFESDERSAGVLAMGFFDYVHDPVPVLRRMRELRTTPSWPASRGTACGRRSARSATG